MFSVLISIVVLAIAGALIFRLLFKDSISRQKRNIEETDHPETKAELTKKSNTANDFIISRLEQMLAAIKAAFGSKEPETDYDRHHKAQIIWRLVVVGILLDWLIQWMVNQRMPMLSPLGWVIPSLFVALLLTWFVELSAFAITDDQARGARGERICRDAMIVTGIVSVAGMLLFLYGRTVSAASVSDWLIAVISGSLWIVAEGLGISCGFAAAWARHVDRNGRAAKECDRIKRQLQPRYEFREWLEDQEVKSKMKAALTAFLLFLALIPATSGFAQIVARPNLIILIDGTASVDQVRLSDALSKLRELAPALAGKYGRVKVGVFTDEGPFTIISAVTIPPLSSIKDCGARFAKSFRQDLTVIFPGIREYQDSQKTKQCLAANASVEQKNREILKTATAKLLALLPTSIEPKPGCTAIGSLLRFILSSHPSSDSTVFLLTDGNETCSDAVPRLQIPAGMKLFLFLLPSMGAIEKEGPEALKRGEIWQASIPGLQAPPSASIAETIVSPPE